MTINSIFKHRLVLIKGAGDLASGVAYRLKRSGFPLMMTELPAPRMVRRTVCFGEAVYSQSVRVEGISAQRVESVETALRLARSGTIPVLVDPDTTLLKKIKPAIVVDAVMAKRNTGTSLADASLVIALGPGFIARQDCHAVIETNRGHWLGRVIYEGAAEPDTGRPGPVEGYRAERVLRAPIAGHVEPAVQIGDALKEGDLIATVAGREVRAPFNGMLRGLIHPTVPVSAGTKIGDLDPRVEQRYCFTISDKSLAMGGAVLEAILASSLACPGRKSD